MHYISTYNEAKEKATMEFLNLLLLISFLWPILIHLFKSKILTRNSVPLPPGPRPLPVIGNILQLGKNPHQSTAKLCKTYGPLMSLKLGSMTSIVISSPELAKLALQKHDQALSNRSVPDAARALDHHNFSVLWLPASDLWRTLRKLMSTEFFSLRKMEATQDLRREKVRDLMDFVRESGRLGRAVDIGAAAFTTVLNLLTTTLFSKDLASYNSDKSRDFYDVVVCILDEYAKPNLSEFFPVLRLLDPQRIRHRTKALYCKLLEMFDRIIAERLVLRSSATQVKESKDVLDCLLDICLESNSKLSLHDMKHFLVDIFIGATDTITKTFEWGMAEVLRSPEKLAKLKDELKQVEGEIRESNIANLPYLQATVNEVYRLHPVAPFLVPHEAKDEVEIGGFRILENAQVLIHVWAMGRDEKRWENVESFEPERFLGREIDVKGTDFELLPFGAGRRICPGLPLAQKMLHLMLASLVRSFDWTLPDGMKPHELDMTEKYGLVIQKAKPLLAIPSV